MISEEQYIESAKSINVESATIKAVAEVESTGDGFLSPGEPKILFEPHIFWKELKNTGVKPEDHVKGNEDILYQKWGTKPYGKVSEQHGRLERAIKINREAALKSASWGRFQILGNNYKASGFTSIQDFINAMYKSENDHLKAFIEFVKSNGLVKFLQSKSWADFAKGYNGSSYKDNKYDIKLAEAYKKYSK